MCTSCGGGGRTSGCGARRRRIIIEPKGLSAGAGTKSTAVRPGDHPGYHADANHRADAPAPLWRSCMTRPIARLLAVLLAGWGAPSRAAGSRAARGPSPASVRSGGAAPSAHPSAPAVARRATASQVARPETLTAAGEDTLRAAILKDRADTEKWLAGATNSYL